MAPSRGQTSLIASFIMKNTLKTTLQPNSSTQLYKSQHPSSNTASFNFNVTQHKSPTSWAESNRRRRIKSEIQIRSSNNVNSIGIVRIRNDDFDSKSIYFWYKAIIIDRFWYKFDLAIDPMSIIQLKIVEFNQKWLNLIEKVRFSILNWLIFNIIKLFWYKFEVRFEISVWIRIVATISMHART